jgi:hypothetical protein
MIPAGKPVQARSSNRAPQVLLESDALDWCYRLSGTVQQYELELDGHSAASSAPTRLKADASLSRLLAS